MTVNQQTLEGNWNEIKGKLRERWGQLSGNELDSAQGNVEQLVGTIQRKTGEARESVERYLEELAGDGASMLGRAAETVRNYAAGATGSAQDIAQQTAEAVRAGYNKTEEVVRRRPVESLAVCFGVGLITGVVVGLLVRSR